ncbi:protein kinase shaggy-like [Penaeus chinensis]|uniref:protein kinase shaggy-like n=1 Tax=Penaeus chinensis TaxID=139456 RepID=UPI001FB5B0A5|nr:protein kinase shaggy-like [Penaeus chinensis]
MQQSLMQCIQTAALNKIIIHRDIKPENVLVSRLGVVKLCDFGFARLLAGPGESCTDYVATRWYRAPELLVGDTKYGREVDVWASGCLLSEMLTGEPLFPGESDIDQLFHIIQTLGDLMPVGTLGELSTPHRQLVERNPMLAGLRLPAAASTPLSASFPNWSSRAHAFVSACLCLEPVSRPSAQELLNHEFFTHDGFPETFLPVLRQKVQQEFSTNVLLGMTGGGGRRGSSTPARRTQGRKVTGGGSPESVYGRSIGRAPQPTTTATTTTARADTTTIPARSSPTKHTLQTTGPRPTVSFATLTPSHSRTGASIQSLGGVTTFTAAGGGGVADEGLMLPMRELHTANSNTTSINNNNNTIALTLHITGTTNTASPARTTRASDKCRKSPVNIWGSSLKARGQGLCIQGQGQTPGQSQGQGHWDDDDHFGAMIADGPPSFTAVTASSRHLGGDLPRTPAEHARASDMSRHPYTISLDRTKELVARDSPSSFRDFTRDPLKEIKDNPLRDPLRDPLGYRDSLRRPRLEVMGWAKPRLLNDDLSLPNVPGGKARPCVHFVFC